MGYRDDFYVVDNIVGYTGDIEHNPTVYFLKKGPTRTFGHISQHHDVPENIGRETVRTDKNYKAGNLGKDQASKRFYEFWTGNKHKSRNYLIFRKDFQDGDLEILSQAIYNFPELKKWCKLSATDQIGAKRESKGEKADVKELIKAFEAGAKSK